MNADKRPELVTLGHAAVDIGTKVGTFPEPDTKLLAEELSLQGGGPAATAAAAASRLGVRTAFLGTVGDDFYGQFIKNEFEKDGVNISGLITRPGTSSPLSLIIVQPLAATRTIIWSRGTSGVLSPNEIDNEIIGNAKCLLVDGHHMDASIAAARTAREHDVPVVFDAGSMKPDTEKLLEYVDHLIASQIFAEEFTGHDDPGAALLEFSKQGFRHVAITSGEKGVFFLKRKHLHYQRAFPVAAIDTTGAGDVFHGAYAFGLVQDFNMSDCVEVAAAAAAMKCTKLGARAAMPTLEELDGFLRKKKANISGKRKLKK